jgi:carbamoyl-phosphate synthase large subunit
LKPKKKRIWADFDVKMIGVDVNAINTEDREQFKQLKNRCSIYLQKFVLLLERKEIAQVWFSISDSSSFTWRNWAAIVYKKEDFDDFYRG